MTRVLILSLLLSASASATTYGDGKAMVKEGRFYDAVRFWLDALDEDEFDQGAIKGLDRYAESAYEQRLDEAQEHEAERRFEKSIETYDLITELNVELSAVAAIEYPDHSNVVDREREDAWEAWAGHLLREGAVALTKRKWSDAEKNYEEALVMKPDLPEARKQLAKAQTELGHERFAKFKYREAVEYFDKSVANGAGRESKAWASAIHRELGKYYMSKSSCRQGARELRLAGDLSSNLSLVDLLARAEDCARIELIIMPFEEEGGGDMVGSAPAAMLVDRLEAALTDQGSEFLRLLDPDSDTAARALAGGLEGARPGALFQVRGRITQLTVDRPDPTTNKRNTEGRYQEICPLPEGVYYRSDEWCDEVTTIFYEEQGAWVEAASEGSIRLINPTTSEQLMTKPVNAQLKREAMQAVDFVRTVKGEQVAVEVGVNPGESVFAIDPEILGLMEQPTPLPSDSALASEVTTSLAQNMAAAILAEVDHPADVEDPQVIDNFTDPVLDADEIDLSGGQGAVEVEPPPPPPPPEPDPDVPPTKAVIPK